MHIVKLIICVNLYLNWLIRKDPREMIKFFFLKITTMTLTLTLKFWIANYCKILSHYIFE